MIFYLSVCHIRNVLYFFCTRSADNTRTPHFQNYLATEWMVFQLNEHTAQSPLVDGRILWLLQPAEDLRIISFIILTIENIYLKLYFCQAFYFICSSEVAEQSNRTADGPAVF